MELPVLKKWTDKTLVIDGAVKSNDGFGHLTENMILAFSELGFNVIPGNSWWQTELDFVYPKVKSILAKGYGKRAKVGVRNSQPDSFSMLRSDFKVGQSMFEFSKMPRDWVAGCNTVALNIVPCNWCKQVWLEAGVNKPVEVNPLGVNTDVYTYTERPERDVFTFCMSGTLSGRKAPWLAWQAFEAAFPNNKDVKLVIKSPSFLPIGRGSNDPHLVPENDDRIVVINESWPKDKMAKLLHDADCFVYPTRSEGAGLSSMEAMATGLPVISINLTGPEMYMFPEHSYPLEIEGWEPVPSHWGDIGSYTTPSLDHLTALMKHVYENREEAKNKGNKAAQYIRDNLTWKHNAIRFIQLVEKYIW